MTDWESEVKEVLESLRPAMETDGGGVELISVKEGVVRIRFVGACLLCPSIGMTMKYGITAALKDRLPWINEVIKE